MNNSLTILLLISKRRIISVMREFCEIPQMAIATSHNAILNSIKLVPPNENGKKQIAKEFEVGGRK